MSFYGKVFTITKSENFDKWIKAVVPDITDEAIAALLAEKSTVKIVQDGDSYILSQFSPKETKDITFKSGVEFDDVIGEKNIPIKTTFTVDGNNITQQVKSYLGSATFKREFNGDDLVVTITSDNTDIVAKRYYKV